MKSITVLLIGLVLGFALATATGVWSAPERPDSTDWTPRMDDAARYGYGQPNPFIVGPPSIPSTQYGTERPGQKHPC